MWKLCKPLAYSRGDPLKSVVHGPPLLPCSMLSLLRPMTPDTELATNVPTASSIASPSNGGFGGAGEPMASQVRPDVLAFHSNPSQPTLWPGALSIHTIP